VAFQTQRDDTVRKIPAEGLIGTWRLVSATETDEDGATSDTFGDNPTGLLNYTAEGRMIGIITSDGRRNLSVPDWVAAPIGERAEAFATMVAYAGRYTVLDDRVIHHIEAAWMQNVVNRDVIRFVELRGDQMTLCTPEVRKGGRRVVQRMTWERVR
jgi:hypothetical protein